MKILIPSFLISLILSIFGASAADIWFSERIAVFGSFAGLQYSLNPGIAWGIQLPPIFQEILIGGALIAVGYLAIKDQGTQKFSMFNVQFSISRLAFGFILGGGLANIIDRLRDGYVTDYFQIGSFPIFNVADSFVTVGVGMLLLEAVVKKKY